MKRPKGVMSMELFRKIIDEAATIPLIGHVTITGLGEPLLDRFLVERMKYVREKMQPGVMLDVYTNGGPLTVEKGLELADAGVSIVYVSVNGVNQEKRYQVMRLDDYDKVAATVHALMDELKASGRTMRVIAKAIVSKDLMEGTEVDEFINEWGGRTENGGNAFLHHEGNWAGAMYPMRIKPTTPCNRALGEIMVLQDGRVSLCCFDSEGDVIYGDLNHQTIRETFASEKALMYRTKHVEGKRQELPLCATCTAI